MHGLLKDQRNDVQRVRSVVLSPRGADRAHALADSYTAVTVAESNSDVVTSTDVVVVAVRPQQLEEALEGVAFREGQIVISVIAGVDIDTLNRVISQSGVDVVRSIPLPPVAEHGVDVPIYPGHPLAVDFFNSMGGALIVENEEELAVLSAVTGSCAGLLQYVSILCDWATERGVARQVAEPFARDVIASLSTALRDRDSSIGDVISSHETPGGLNEQLRTEFFSTVTSAELRTALDVIYERASATS